MSIKAQNNGLGLFVGAATAYTLNDLSFTTGLFSADRTMRAATMAVLGGASAYGYMSLFKGRQTDKRRLAVAGIGAAAAAVLSYFTPNLQAAGVPGFAGFGLGRALAMQPQSRTAPCPPGYSKQWVPGPTGWTDVLACRPTAPTWSVPPSFGV